MNSVSLNENDLKIRECKKFSAFKTKALLPCLLTLLLLCTGQRVSAHGVVVSSVAIKQQNTLYHYSFVEFNIVWNNSWKLSTGTQNWDACWVFIKYRKKGESTWNHATLNTSGHTAPGTSTISTPTDGKGVFIYSNTFIGSGSVWYTGVKLRWNYGVDGIADNDKVEIHVIAIEMVYVPQGNFYVGDGTTAPASTYANFESGTTGAPFQITSEAAITLGGGGAGSLGNNNSFRNNLVLDYDDFNDATTKTLPADFPKGHKAFYCMKYEITQEQYVQFLNTLTYAQQKSRTYQAPNSVTGTLALTTPGNEYRNSIVVWTPGVANTTPATYACNLDGDGIYDETTDGQNISCNYLGWANIASYLDWAGLRPMTELEYEKACRGNQTPVLNEYAWGNSTVTGVSGISNSGANSESPSNAAANSISGAVVMGPMRGGSMGFGVNTRSAVGASYYGIMDMTGNLLESVVTVGYFGQRKYTGLHGDGKLDANGYYDVTNWPIWLDIYSGLTLIERAGIGLRGGHFAIGNTRLYELRVSDRSQTTNLLSFSDPAVGGRGVRTAP